MVTNSGYQPSSSPPSSTTTSAYIFPTNLYLSSIPTASASVLQQLIKGYFLSSASTPVNELNSPPFSPRKVHETHILICTHYSRDKRCGLIGTALYGIFSECLRERGLLHPESHDVSARGKVRVGAISHMGGHKYAGNVIVYQPPEEDAWEQGGEGIWYGRVGTKRDAEEIIDSTVLSREIIERLFRGRIGLQRLSH